MHTGRTPKEAVRPYLYILAYAAGACGVFIVQGGASWLRGDPTYWLAIALVPLLILTTFMCGRTILRLIP